MAQNAVSQPAKGYVSPVIKTADRPIAQTLAVLETDIRRLLVQNPVVQTKYNKWNSYVAHQLQLSKYSFEPGGYNGLARLSWYEHLLLSPLHAYVEMENFSRIVQANLALRQTRAYISALELLAQKMDVPYQGYNTFPVCRTPEQAFSWLQCVVREVKSLHIQAISAFSPEELGVLNENLYNILTVNATVGHTVNEGKKARDYILFLEKMNYTPLYQSAAFLFSLADESFLDSLASVSDQVNARNVKALPYALNQRESSVSGNHLVLDTPSGKIIMGSSENNVYRLEQMTGVAAIVDFGGNDVYEEGMVNLTRPVLIIIDYHGNDIYRGNNPGIQGAAIMSVSCLIDCQGNDQYLAQDMAQGSALGGVGILMDFDGDDLYKGRRRVQGTALCGLGMLIDQKGNDRYYAAMWSQGLGHPRGLGLLEDREGKDYYYTGGDLKDSYPETPGYEGWGQGLGAGLRDIANGGIGVLLEGGGDDQYDFDYIAHGGGYWQGVGILRDFSGDDYHAGATTRTFKGERRKEKAFQRFGNGFGCHYAIGFLIDDSGNDAYSSTIMNSGFGWDASAGYLLDFSGNDRYLATGTGSQGCGEQAAFGLLFDYRGNDAYFGARPGYAPARINPTYHVTTSCGGNFAFLIDYSGKDNFSQKYKASNTYRSQNEGWVIDIEHR